MSKSLLPPHLWFVDTVFKKNACPLGHKTRRSGSFLEALYAFHSNHWFSVPELIWGQLYKCWEGLLSRRTQVASMWALPFPALITRILLENGVEPREGDYTDSIFLQFSLPQWNQSTSHMRQQAPAMAPDAMEEDQGKDNAEEEAVQHMDDDAAYGHEPITQVEFRILSDEVAQLHFEIANLHRDFMEDQLQNEQAQQ
jgi:hypothetical protein